MYAIVLILKIFSKVHVPGRCHNHVDVQTNEDEFDRELCEPTHDAWVIKDDMDCLFHDHEHVNGGVSMFNTTFKLIN
jgi:hypothetical protein